MVKKTSGEIGSLESLLISNGHVFSLIDFQAVLAALPKNEKIISFNDGLSTAEEPYNITSLSSLKSSGGPTAFYQNETILEKIKLPLFNYASGDLFKDKKVIREFILPENLHKDHAAFVALQELSLPTDHKTNLFFKKDLPLTRTEYLDLSAQFAERIAEMEKQVLPAELNAVLGMLRAGPLLSAIYQLGSVLADKSKQVSPKAREQVDRLVQIYHHSTSSETPIGQLMGHKVPFHGRVGIFDPATQNSNRLNEMLVSGGACTAQSYALGNRPADSFAEDAKVGGSVHFLYSQVSPSQSAYSRLYLAVDHEGNPVAFYDCLESGDLSRCSVNGYIQSGLQSHFLASFAASLVIANCLGIDKVAFGDMELVEAARDLGFGERRIFSENQNQADQKLGYRGESSTGNAGPYMWMMKGSRNFRTLDPSLFQPESLILLVNQAQQVMGRISTDRKSVKRLRSDYETFFGMVREVYEVTRSATGETADQLIDQVDGFCRDMGLNLDSSLYRKERIIPQQPPIQMASSFY
ncbi:MAG: hypothetical protein WCV90_07880 [Candidatus Woesearchaeota archaeon]|jgi:hypothetical protein